MSSFLYLSDFCNACYHGLSKTEVRTFYFGKLVQDICIQYNNKLLDTFFIPYKHDYITYENSCKNFKIGEEPRWRRSRTGRTLSPPQIHQKSI